MNSWAEDLLTALDNAPTQQGVFATIEKAAKALGFEQCAYGLRTPIPLSNPRVIMLNNYPKGWQERYTQAGYLQTDPTVRHCRKSQSPLIWSDQVFADAQEFWADAQSFGLKVGWAQSSLDVYGGGGMLTLCRSSEPLSQTELDDKQMKMHWLANVAHTAMARAITRAMRDEDQRPLTPKETDILKWCADGKTSGEIAEIMAISVNTVNFHIKNATSKLRSANKTAAVVRAAMLGLLS